MSSTPRAAGTILLLLLPAAASGQATRERPWRGPDGKPLPFANDEQVLEFLETARVVHEETITKGINRPKKLLLEKDGVRAHAIFREVQIDKRNVRVGDRVYVSFVDSYRLERAAYVMSRLLGIDSVPPTVIREIDRVEGSLQIWIENVIDETRGGFDPPDPKRWARQLWDMYFFDNLVLNVDRNPGNVLVDTRYKLWLVDHTRAFQAISELLDDRVRRVNRRVWKRFRKLTKDKLRSAVGSYLNPRQLVSLYGRHERLVAHVEKLIAEHGEDVVFY